MVVSEGAINNIMGGMESNALVRLHSHRHKLKQRFNIVRKLGQGTYGKVQLAIYKETGQEVAIKTIKKAKIETEQDLVRIRREIQIMSSVQHPQIIHIYEVFENPEKMVLVMEYAAGGELYDYLSERKVLPETEARRVFRQVASAVYYCHKHKICHRDLKLENILLDLNGNAKIADFGLSNVFDEKQRLDTFCGSPLYASPEIVKGVPYLGPEVDCWSLGVLLYTLVYGAMPFDGSNFRRLVKQITQGDFYEPSTPATASELIRHMLTVSPTERATVEDICSHWWVNEGYPESCLTEAEALASQTPVRLDLLLSLAPKQISSEHMLIQPDDEDVSQKSDLSRAPPELNLPPPPPPEECVSNGVVPLRSHSLGAVPPPGGVSVDLLLEKKKEKRKKESTSKRPPTKPQAAEEESEEKKKTTKKREISAEREGGRPKKRDVSAERERKKSSTKKRESSLTRKTPTKEREEEKGEEKTLSPLPPLSPEEQEESLAVKDVPTKDTPETDVPKQDVPKTDSLSVASLGPCPTPCSTPCPSKAPEAEETKEALDKDTEAILKETAAKIEAVESLMKEGERTSPLASPPPSGVVSPATSAVMSPAMMSPPVGSTAASSGASPARSRTGSESSTDAHRPSRSESSSRRQSKIFSKAALFDPALAAQTSKSPPPPTDRAKRRLGALNMNDLAKRFEEKPSPAADKKKVVAPFKVSDARKAFESRSDSLTKATSESPRRKASVGSNSGDSGLASPKETPVTPSPSTKEAPVTPSPSTKEAKAPPVSKTERGSRESSPIKKVSKSPSKEVPPARKKEKSPSVLPPSRKERSPKKETSPVKQLATPKVTSSVLRVKEDVKRTVPEKTAQKEPPKESPRTKTSQLSRGNTPDSSDSESEAEKILRELSVKREKLEMAKKEKMKKVSEDTPKSKPTSPAGSATSSGGATPPEGGDQKYATLPRGFRAKPSSSEVSTMGVKATKPKIPTSSQDEDMDSGRALLVDENLSSTPQEGPQGGKEPPLLKKEVFSVPPEQVLASTPRSPERELASLLPKTNSFEEASVSSDTPRKKTQMEIVLNHQQPRQAPPTKRSSFAEIQISSPTSREDKHRPEFRTEVQHSVAPPEAGAPPEPHLQRARRERIIPIMLEEDVPGYPNGEEEFRRVNKTSSRSSGIQPSSSSSSRTSSVSSAARSTGGYGAAPIPTTVTALAGASDRKKSRAAGSPEPIKKSRRERIIPISVEGEGLVTPPVLENPPTDKTRTFQRQGSGQSSYSRGRAFTLDRAESFSSAGEDDDDEEEDGFQILTAESLFSTLLARVRSLTRKMASDEGGRIPVSGGPLGGDRTRRTPQQSQGNSEDSSSSPGGFWSSLYSPPRDLPTSRRVSDSLSRGHSRDDDTFGGFSGPLWGRANSRDASENESVFSELSNFSTLPRGWRTRRSGREESVVDGDRGFSSFSPSRRQFYSRTLSRDLPIKDGDDAKVYNNRNSWDASTSTGSLPRSGQATGQTLPTKFGQEPVGGMTSYGNVSRSSYAPSPGMSESTGRRERPLSTAGGSLSSSGEATGRVGGHYERRNDNFATQSASFSSIKDIRPPDTTKSKQSVQQLQELVNELESIPDEDLSSELSGKPRGKVTLTVVPSGGKIQLAAPKSSKSLSSFQKQNQPTIHSSSNPNLVFNISIPRPTTKLDVTNHSVANSKSHSNLKTINERIRLPLSPTTSATSLKHTQKTFPTEYTFPDVDEKVKINQSKEHKSSDEQSPKNIFIPYNPNLNPSTSHKNLYIDKHISLNNEKNKHSTTDDKQIVVNKQTTLAIEDKRNKATESTKSSKSTEVINCEKQNGFISRAEVQNDAPAHSVAVSKRNDEQKRLATIETKASMAMEPYRRGRSEDLRSAIDAVNTTDPTKEVGKGTARIYRRSKSRDITPAIEAVGEKLTQFNSGPLKRISPFEAYRRSKSRELGATIDLVRSETRMKSPPPTEIIPKSNAAAMSQFEKAKNSIEKKFEKAKSPPLENDLGISEPSKQAINSSKDLKAVSEATKQAIDSSKELKASPSSPVPDIPKETEKTKENDKPKSVYKMLTSKLGRSLSNLGDEKQPTTPEDENGDKEDKFKLKRPSRFLKTRMEKSSSRTSFCETEPAEEEEEKSERKSSKKLPFSLNRFLGRKTDDVEKKVLPTKSTSAAIISDKTKKPPKFKSKKLSKSQENLNDEEKMKEDRGRATSVHPEKLNSNDKTLESATKDLCNHLSQIEINITSRIGSMSPPLVTSPVATSPSITTSLVPSLPSGGGLSVSTHERGTPSHNHTSTRKLSPLLMPEREMIGRRRSPGNCSDDGSITPTTESGNESTYSGMEELRDMEDESVMDRITRKSYYSRFNEIKRKPKPKRADTKEEIDQQLAAAKARLMQEDQQGSLKISGSVSPSRLTPTTTSPPPAWEGVKKRNSKTNLSPRSVDEENKVSHVRKQYQGQGVRSPTPEESQRAKEQRTHREGSSFSHRSSGTFKDDAIPYRRQSSTNLDDLINYKRLSSTGKDDPSYYLRQPSVSKEEQPTYRLPSSRRSSITKDDPQSYKRLSSSSNFEEKVNFKRLSSVPRDDYGYKSLTSPTAEENAGYHTLQYKKPSLNDDSTFSRYNSPHSKRDSLTWQPGRTERFTNETTSPSVSPSITLNQKRLSSVTANGADRPSEMWEVASAAGKAAGEAAAASMSLGNCSEPSRDLSSPTSPKSGPELAAVKSAREELTRRLTPLTRLSNMNSGREPTVGRPYRRTMTSGSLPMGQSEANRAPSVERPAYKRTSTIDLPPTDSRIRTTDYRRVLQDPTRRFTGVRIPYRFPLLRKEMCIQSVPDGANTPVTPTFPGRTSPSVYSPTSVFPSSYSPPSMNTLLKRGSLYR